MTSSKRAHDICPIPHFLQGYGSSSTLVVSVYAIDTFGATARSTFSVTVEPFHDGIFELAEILDENQELFLEAGNIDSLMQVWNASKSLL